MRYRTRPGAVLARICGEYLLVAAQSLRDSLPYVTQLNESSAFLWKKLESGADEQTLEQCVLEEYEVEDRDAARAAIRDFMEQMRSAGYLVEDREGEETNE